MLKKFFWMVIIALLTSRLHRALDRHDRQRFLPLVPATVWDKIRDRLLRRLT
ncbi:MAG: hypothetical protein N3A57_03615 [Negativicutes bacterium]|nr:hypothetical protein [Negativicutes bacterium]